MSQFDYRGLHEFLTQTPEQGLRKMFVDGKPFTDVHFSLLLKIVRGVGHEDFAKHAEAADFPKIKYGPAETKIKDKFWGDCQQVWKSRGLLNPTTKAA
jgi:hypothetical protein